jgi:membrane fusion protein (multidrug efflux system)
VLREKYERLSPQGKKFALYGAAGLVVILLFFSVKGIFFSAKAVKSTSAELIQVRVVKTKVQDFTDNYTVMGTIKGAIENELRFEEDGTLASYKYKEGAKLKKGMVICSLDPKDSLTKTDYARSKYSSERSSYRSAQQRLKVYEDLFKMQALSESKLDEARYETLSAEAKMKAAQSELELAEVLIKPGEYITPQDVIVKFISDGKTNFEVDVPEKDVSKLKIAQNVKINCDSYPGKDFIGTIAEIAPTVKERTRTTTVKIDIPNNDGQLRSGMFGRGTIFLMELKNVILVNSDSIVSLGDKTFLVPVVKADPKAQGEGIIEMRHVKTGVKTSTGLTVIDDGLLKDDLVVAETQGQLSDGLKVKFSIITPDSKPAGSQEE